jgi:hypothetical protein
MLKIGFLEGKTPNSKEKENIAAHFGMETGVLLDRGISIPFEVIQITRVAQRKGRKQPCSMCDDAHSHVFIRLRNFAHIERHTVHALARMCAHGW